MLDKNLTCENVKVNSEIVGSPAHFENPGGALSSLHIHCPAGKTFAITGHKLLS